MKPPRHAVYFPALILEIALALAILGALFVVPGCKVLGLSGASANPFGACKSAGQCYLAAAGTYSAAQQAGLELLHDAATPQSVKDGVKEADAAALPAVQNLSKAYAVYRHAKADLAAGTTTPQKVALATADLNKWLAEAAPLIQHLTELTGG